MRLTFCQDLILNVAVPILAGSLIYLLFQHADFCKIGYNYLPDGLWAYALLSTILIIWNRVIHVFWIVMSLILFVGFEGLQHLHIVQGTGDFLDVFTYYLFGFMALLANKYFIRIKQQ